MVGSNNSNMPFFLQVERQYIFLPNPVLQLLMIAFLAVIQPATPTPNVLVQSLNGDPE